MTCLLGFFLTLLVISIPSAIAIAILWWLDRYEKEPLWLAAILFLWGAIPAAIFSVISQVVIDAPLTMMLGKDLSSPLSAIFVAPLTEETAKGLIILAIFVFFRHEFDSVMDGVLYGALVGFGFTFIEDILYLMGALDEGGWSGWGVLAFLRVGLYLMNHSLFTACIGAGFGFARMSRGMWKKIFFIIAGWLLAMTLHAIHNTGASLGKASGGVLCLGATLVDWIGVWMILALILIVLDQERRWFEQLDAEAQAGIITPEELEWARDLRVRGARGWHIFWRYGLVAWFRWSRHVQMIVDLAYKKHQRQTADDGADADRRIEVLRQRIAQTRQTLKVF